VLILALLAPISLGAPPGTGGTPPRRPFVEVPGRMEFSGCLLVRPVQAATPSADASQHDAQAQRSAQARTLIAPNVVEYIADLDTFVVAVPQGSDENRYAAQLLDTDLFEYATPDWILYPLASPNDPLYPQQWHLPKIQAPGAWRFTMGRPSIIVAFVDTGVDLVHPDVAPNLVSGYNSFFMSRRAQQDGGKVSDDLGHGTSVAGSAVAIANNGLGGCAVGSGLRIMPIRSTNPNSASGGAFLDDLINGAVWATIHGARVVNISFTGVSSPAVETLGQTLENKGALLVWPMDTMAAETTFKHPHALIVNGTDSADRPFSMDDWGPGVDLAAPAVNILIPTKGGGYGLRTGNSFAAPIVAGAAGLVWSIDPSLTPTQVRNILRFSASDIGAPGFDEFCGYGRLDANIAVVTAALGCAGNSPRMVVGLDSDDIVTALRRWTVKY
jgi:subtilisin family serine protease